MTVISPPRMIRHRLDLVMRTLTVADVQHVTPIMLRITVEGPELNGFTSPAPDDNIKVFLDQPDGTVEKRSYTPRSFDPATNRLVLDFVDHPGGPAADWARAAKVGDSLRIGGPRGSKEMEGPLPRVLLIGDETALPAIGRWIEESTADSHVTAVIAVPTPEDEQPFDTQALVDTHWVHRPLEMADDPTPVLAALDSIDLAPDTFVWIAAEASVAKAARSALEARGVAKGWLRASGYWTKGVAEGSVKEADMTAA